MKVTFIHEEGSENTKGFNFGAWNEEGKQIALFVDENGSLDIADMNKNLSTEQINKLTDLAINHDTGTFVI